MTKPFDPTYLMIKKHKVTGLMYFCKTSTRNPLKYYGSGKYWRKHLKVHGRHVETIWYQQFTDKEDLVEFALFFSEFYDIVNDTKCSQKIWANEVPEDGLHGGQNRGMPSPLKGKKQPHVTAALKGKKRPEHSKTMKGVSKTEAHKQKIAIALREHERTKEHCENISKTKKGKCNPKVSVALKGKPSANKGKKLSTYKCLHCDVKTTGGNLKRWHNDNCKQKRKKK